MATAVFNNKAIQASAGQLYLIPAPTAVVGVTPAAIVKEFFGLFYVDGDKRDTLLGTIKPWSVLESSGFKAKIDQKPIKVNPNDGPEYVIGFEDISFSAEANILDLDMDKLGDILSAVASQKLATVKSLTQAGRTTLLAGGQVIPATYMALYRYASRQVIGEWRHVLIPQCNITADGEKEYSKGKVQSLKVKLGAQTSDFLLDPVTGRGVVWLEDYVTEAKG